MNLLKGSGSPNQWFCRATGKKAAHLVSEGDGNDGLNRLLKALLKLELPGEKDKNPKQAASDQKQVRA